MTPAAGGQRGQAMVEAAVAAVLLALLISALPSVLLLHDAQRTAARAARDAALGAPGWSAGDRSEVRRLAEATVGSLPWRHRADGSLVFGADAAGVEVVDAGPPGRAAAMLGFISEPLRQPGGYLGGEFDPSGSGYRQARVSVRVPPLRGAPAPFDAGELVLDGRGVVLADAWNAGGSAQVERRVSGLVPTRLLDDAQRPIQAFTSLLRLIEPAYAQFCPGLIEVEELPAHRLGAARSGQPVPTAGRCR